MAVLSPNNHGQQLRIFTVTEDSSIDGLVVGPGQDVRIYKQGGVFSPEMGVTVTFTNLTKDDNGLLTLNGNKSIGLSGSRIELLYGYVCYYVDDTFVGSVLGSDTTLTLSNATQIALKIGATSALQVGNEFLLTLGTAGRFDSLPDPTTRTGQLGYTHAGTPNGSPGLAFSDGTKWIAITQFAAADTGWTANASAGDKTVAVADYDSTTIDGMTAGLNLVLAGFGTAVAALADQVEALTKKFQALEAAGAANLLPNA